MTATVHALLLQALKYLEKEETPPADLICTQHSCIAIDCAAAKLNGSYGRGTFPTHEFWKKFCLDHGVTAAENAVWFYGEGGHQHRLALLREAIKALKC